MHRKAVYMGHRDRSVGSHAGTNLPGNACKNEHCCEKTYLLHMRKKRCRSAAQLICAFVFATYIVQSPYFRNLKPLTIFCGCTSRFVLHLVGNPQGRFSLDAAQISSSKRCSVIPAAVCINGLTSPSGLRWFHRFFFFWLNAENHSGFPPPLEAELLNQIFGLNTSLFM